MKISPPKNEEKKPKSASAITDYNSMITITSLFSVCKDQSSYRRHAKYNHVHIHEFIRLKLGVMSV